jgi:hypothetical protein
MHCSADSYGDCAGLVLLHVPNRTTAAATSERSSLGDVLGEAASMALLLGLLAAVALMAFARPGNPRPASDGALQAQPPAALAAYQAQDFPCPPSEALAFYIVVGAAASPFSGTASNGAAVATVTEATLPGLIALIVDGNGILTAMGQPGLLPIVIRLPT